MDELRASGIEVNSVGVNVFRNVLEVGVPDPSDEIAYALAIRYHTNLIVLIESGPLINQPGTP